MTLWKRFLGIALCLCLCLLCTTMPIPAEAAAVTDLPISITGSARSYQYAKSGKNLTELQYGTTTANKTAGSITTAKTSGGGTKFTLTPKSVSYTIYLNYGNGSVNNTKKTVKYGEPYGELPSPTRDGCNFGGWYPESYGYGGEVFSTTEVTNPASHTLYVYWVPEPSPNWGARASK